MNRSSIHGLRRKCKALHPPQKNVMGVSFYGIPFRHLFLILVILSKMSVLGVGDEVQKFVELKIEPAHH